MSKDRAKPKNPNDRKYTPKAGPNSPGYRGKNAAIGRKTKRRFTNGKGVTLTETLTEAIARDKLENQAATAKELMHHMDEVNPTMAEACEMVIDNFAAAKGHISDAKRLGYPKKINGEYQRCQVERGQMWAGYLLEEAKNG